MLVHLLYLLEVEHALGLPHNSPTKYMDMDTHGWCVHCPLPDWQCVNTLQTWCFWTAVEFLPVV